MEDLIVLKVLGCVAVWSLSGVVSYMLALYFQNKETVREIFSLKSIKFNKEFYIVGCLLGFLFVIMVLNVNLQTVELDKARKQSLKNTSCVTCEYSKLNHNKKTKETFLKEYTHFKFWLTCEVDPTPTQVEEAHVCSRYVRGEESKLVEYVKFKHKAGVM